MSAGHGPNCQNAGHNGVINALPVCSVCCFCDSPEKKQVELGLHCHIQSILIFLTIALFRYMQLVDQTWANLEKREQALRKDLKNIMEFRKDSPHKGTRQSLTF